MFGKPDATIALSVQQPVRIPAKRWLILSAVAFWIFYQGWLLPYSAEVCGMALAHFALRNLWRRLPPYLATRALCGLRTSDFKKEFQQPPKLRWIWWSKGVWRVTWKVPGGETAQIVARHQATMKQMTGKDTVWRNGRRRQRIQMLAGSVPKRIPYATLASTSLPPGRLPVWLGQQVMGPISVDVRRSTIIVGSSGEGKSSTQRSIVMQLAERYSPEQVKLALVDPGGELAIFEPLPHVVYAGFDSDAAEKVLASVVVDMKQRLAQLKEAGFEDIERWNAERPGRAWPYLVVVMDELAQLTLDKKRTKAVEDLRQICAMGRKVGVVPLLATQRSDAESVPGSIKVNIMQTVAHRVTNATSSRVLIEADDAAELPENDPGQAILSWGGLTRFRALWLSKTEARERVDKVCKRLITPTVELPEEVEIELEEAETEESTAA